MTCGAASSQLTSNFGQTLTPNWYPEDSNNKESSHETLALYIKAIALVDCREFRENWREMEAVKIPQQRKKGLDRRLIKDSG